jgi:glutathionylspermidine amidase/synthetase
LSRSPSVPRKKAKPAPAKFGTVLGVAPGNVPAYSSDYTTADPRELPDRHAFRSYVDGIYMGYKWQCVEFARRWLYLNKGYIFDDVAMAYEIFRLRSVRVVRDNSRLPLRSFRNGSKRHPEPDCLLIWEEGGEFEHTGHVAVVTEVTPDYIRFVEQNVGHRVWPEGKNYAREIKAKLTEDGEYWLECSFGDATILGWVIQTDDDTHAEPPEVIDPRLFNLDLRELPDSGQAQVSWLNVANADEAAYVQMMRGHKLTSNDADQFKYYCLSETAHQELRRATNELHALFMHATDYVLREEALLEKFNIPRALWKKIQQSWANRRNQMITGRFDFSVSERGIKVYEYNCDSAACYMECGKVQGKWAEHFECTVGWDPGEDLHNELREAWRRSDVDDVLHILHDSNLEEAYHALFMQEAMDEAGIRTKIICGFDGLTWDGEGNILDPDGERIRWVWKTWAWETALDQIRAECEDDEEKLRNYQAGEKREGTPRLVDVLLRQDVMVYEPLWTLIPSNKAILPVLWTLFPNHPYLLESSFGLTDSLRQGGYVTKPIAGRSGYNISIFDADSALLHETSGRFQRQNLLFQQFFRLPAVGGYNVQVSTFTAGGRFAGACARVDHSLVIDLNSDNMPLRVVDDDDILRDYAFDDGIP